MATERRQSGCRGSSAQWADLDEEQVARAANTLNRSNPDQDTRGPCDEASEVAHTAACRVVGQATELARGRVVTPRVEPCHTVLCEELVVNANQAAGRVTERKLEEWLRPDDYVTESVEGREQDREDTQPAVEVDGFLVREPHESPQCRRARERHAEERDGDHRHQARLACSTGQGLHPLGLASTKPVGRPVLVAVRRGVVLAVSCHA